MPKPKKPSMTKEEWTSYRESRNLVLKRIQEAHVLLRHDPAAALRRLDEAGRLATQLKVIARTYLRRLKRP